MGNKATSIPFKEFHSKTQSAFSFFKFSDSSPVLVNPVSDTSSWTSTYNQEIAEMCKHMVPSAEAVCTIYHVLRKADLSFSKGKYNVNPSDPNCKVHQAATKMVDALNTIDFQPVVDQERWLGLLSGPA